MDNNDCSMYKYPFFIDTIFLTFYMNHFRNKSLFIISFVVNYNCTIPIKFVIKIYLVLTYN